MCSSLSTDYTRVRVKSRVLEVQVRVKCHVSEVQIRVKSQVCYVSQSEALNLEVHRVKSLRCECELLL